MNGRYEDAFTIRWFRDGVLHRDDGPAVERPDGTKEWHQDGFLHREDGPAIERGDGTKIWAVRGRTHREDGPAIVAPTGSSWWSGDVPHRTDGPAVIHPTEGFQWWVHGTVLHEREPLDKLWAEGDLETLEQVLLAWKPGFSVASLVEAVIAAK